MLHNEFASSLFLIGMLLGIVEDGLDRLEGPQQAEQGHELHVCMQWDAGAAQPSDSKL